MKVTRRQLRSALQREATRPVPAPSSAFVDSLERRVLGDHALVEVLTPIPFRRSRRAGIAAAVAVASLAAASVAAAVPAMRSGRVHVVPASSETTIVTTSIPSVMSTATTEPSAATATTQPTATTEGAVTTEQTVTTDALVPGESAAIELTPSVISPSTVTTNVPRVVSPATIKVPTPTPTVVATTVATATPTTQPSTTTSAAAATTSTTSTSEPTAPASLSIQCAAVSTSSIRCTWTKSSDNRVTGYRLLRGAPSGPGRVFSTGPGDSGYTDTAPTSGVRYSFLVHALDGSGTSLGHSQLVYVTC